MVVIYMCYCCGCFFCDGCDQTTNDLVKISDCVKAVSYFSVIVMIMVLLLVECAFLNNWFTSSTTSFFTCFIFSIFYFIIFFKF